MITRDSEQNIRTLLRGFPIVTLTGPRQSGKTTLAKAIMPTGRTHLWEHQSSQASPQKVSIGDKFVYIDFLVAFEFSGLIRCVKRDTI